MPIEARPDLVETSKAIAAESDFERMRFRRERDPRCESFRGKADVVTALHACDTATDEAILFALAARRELRPRAVLPGPSSRARLEGSKKPGAPAVAPSIQRREFGAI
jgi:hypothetical protein